MNRQNKKKRIAAVVSMLLLLFSLAGCGKPVEEDTDINPNVTADTIDQTDGVDADIDSIEVLSNPDKTDYYIGDTYDFTGGIILVKMKDGTTKEIPMTDSEIEYSTTEASSIGNKSITIFYGDERTNIRFTVDEQGYVVTYNLNYEGAPESETTNVSLNETVEKIEDPTRDGYTFYNWYTDQLCTVEYDFNTAITQDISLYAMWKQDGSNYNTVSYNMNYYGVVPAEYKQEVIEGATANELAIELVREDYEFAGWYLDENVTIPYDENQTINDDTMVYAKWDKTKIGESTYVFEAELTDLTGKSGPGFSGSSSEKNMIVFNEDVNASENRYISYLYKIGNSIEFYIASDEDASNVTLIASLSAEMADMTITPDNYIIKVNDIPINYDDISFTNVPTSTNDGACLPFEDYTISANVALKKGANVITFVTSNSDNFVGSGTILGTAPLVDAIKISTDSVLIWDANFNLPMSSNFGG